MQIVIDIPEDTYKRTKFYKEFRDLNDCVLVLKAIEHAIELPEGHGRIADIDELHNTFKKACDAYNINNISFISDVDMHFDLSPTIIESDKAESEG